MRKFLRRFFVSSTFRDFHAERDLLSRQVISDFRDEARKHGEEAVIVDLRWGLNNFGFSDEKDVVSKVLSVCLDEIKYSAKYSRPFMIIFLGDRFGYVPDRNLVTKEFAKEFDSVTNESITSLEIKYGLKQIENPRCIICLRDIQHDTIPEKFRDVYIETDSISREKLRELKERLRYKYNDRIIEYTADIDPVTGEAKNFFTKDKHKPLGKAILSKILEDCADDWQKYDSLPWQRREIESADNFVANRADLFVGKKRKELVWNLLVKLERSRCLFLRGLPGTGKTSLACTLADTLRQSGRPVCFLQAGSSPQTSNAQSALQQVVYFLQEEVLNLPRKISPPTDYEGLKKYLATLCEKLTPDMEIYFFVDAIERMNADECRSKLEFLPLACENVHCLVTCTPNFEIPKFLFNPAATMENDFNILDDAELYQFFLELTNTEDAEFDKRMYEAIKLRLKAFCGENLSEEDLQEVLEFILANLNPKRDFLEGMRKIPDMLAETAPVTFLVEEISELEGDERRDVLAAMLGRIGKELYEATAVAVLQKEHSGNTLYLEMTAQLLNMIATPELTGLKTPQAIIPLTVSLVNGMPDDTQEVATYIFNLARAILCLNGGKISEAMNLLAVSPRGLRLSDLQELLGEKFNSLDWALIRKFLHNFFTERQGGQIDLSHNIIREGIRRKIDAETFTRLERQIAEHIKTLPQGDFLRSQCAYQFAQKTDDYDFAAQLYAQAHETLEPLLLFDIYAAIRSDDGAFCRELIKNHMDAQDDETFLSILKFFTDEFQTMIFSGSAPEYEIAREVFNELSAQIGEKNLIYYMLKRFQAAYDWQLNKVKDATEICEEIIRWGEEHTELSNKSLFCQTLSSAYGFLARIAQEADDKDKEKIYAERCVYWSKRLAELTTKDTEIYELIAEFNRLAQVGGDLESYNQIYSRCKDLLERNSDNTILSLIVSTCTWLIHENLAQEKLADALALIEEGEYYAQLLLQADANNLEFLKTAALLMAELCLVELHAAHESLGEDYDEEDLLENEFFQAYSRHQYESLRLLNVVYAENMTQANLDLLHETAGKISYTAHKLFGDVLGL